MLHCLRENFSKYLRGITGISIMVYSVPQHFSWLKNYTKRIDSLTLSWRFFRLKQKYCLWWRYFPRATHSPNVFISSQDFHIRFAKIVIDMKISQRSNIQARIITKRELSGRNGRLGLSFQNGSLPFKTGELEHMMVCSFLVCNSYLYVIHQSKSRWIVHWS